MRAYFKACLKGYETSTDVTQLKVNGIIEKVGKWERILRRAEKGARSAPKECRHFNKKAKLARKFYHLSEHTTQQCQIVKQ